MTSSVAADHTSGATTSLIRAELDGGSDASNTSPARSKCRAFLANHPHVSKDGVSGMQPSSEILPWLGRMPKRPQYVAGTLTEPPESVPNASSHNRFETAEAEPLDDPPGMRSGAAPFFGVPKCQFFPTML